MMTAIELLDKLNLLVKNGLDMNQEVYIRSSYSRFCINIPVEDIKLDVDNGLLIVSEGS